MGFSPRVHVRNLPPTFPRRAMIRDRASSLQFLEELVQRLKFACKIIRQRDYYSALVRSATEILNLIESFQFCSRIFLLTLAANQDSAFYLEVSYSYYS